MSACAEKHSSLIIQLERTKESLLENRMMMNISSSTLERKSANLTKRKGFEDQSVVVVPSRDQVEVVSQPRMEALSITSISF